MLVMGVVARVCVLCLSINHGQESPGRPLHPCLMSAAMACHLQD